VKSQVRGDSQPKYRRENQYVVRGEAKLLMAMAVDGRQARASWPKTNQRQ
jgi:hypothetical protein